MKTYGLFINSRLIAVSHDQEMLKGLKIGKKFRDVEVRELSTYGPAV